MQRCFALLKERDAGQTPLGEARCSIEFTRSDSVGFVVSGIDQILELVSDRELVEKRPVSASGTVVCAEIEDVARE